MKNYETLCGLRTFRERYRYLRLRGHVGEETFGFNRVVNQTFYQSNVWKAIRDFIIVRDAGCDLAISDNEIMGRVIVHHINPISNDDIIYRLGKVLDPNNLICTSHATHNAIHYGDEILLTQDPVERVLNDTCPWKKGYSL